MHAPRSVIRDADGFTLIELMLVVLIIGLLAAVAIPNFMSILDQSKSASVKSNCHTVQLLAEDYAARNDGIYAAGIADALPNGITIMDMLPGGQPLANPFTRVRTEPRNGGAASPGETGYAPVVNGGINEGYTIEGYGKEGIVITLGGGA